MAHKVLRRVKAGEKQGTTSLKRDKNHDTHERANAGVHRAALQSMGRGGTLKSCPCSDAGGFQKSIQSQAEPEMPKNHQTHTE